MRDVGMDRGNRRFMIGTTGLAFSGAVLMAAWSQAAPPTAKAAAREHHQQAQVQPVAGERRSSAVAHAVGTDRREAPGAKIATVSGDGGLLSRLFGGDQRSHSQHRSRQHSGGQTGRAAVDWDGIPYHEGHQQTARRGEKAPIRDPGTKRRMQVIRGGTSKRFDTAPLQRRSQTPPAAPQAAPMISAGEPSAEMREEDQRQLSAPLSSRTSSRRSNRRPVDTLVELDAVKAPAAADRPASRVASKPTAPSNSKQHEPLVPQVPKVSRRGIAHETAGNTTSQSRQQDNAAPAPTAGGAKTALQEIGGDADGNAKSGMMSEAPKARIAQSKPAEPSSAGQGAKKPTGKLSALPAPNSGETPGSVAEQQDASPVGSGLENSAGDGQVASYRQPGWKQAAAGDTGKGPVAKFAITDKSRAMTVKPISGRLEEGRRGHAADAKTSRSADTTAASELPGVRVVTQGPGEIMIGEIHPYEIRVENRGSLNAEDLQIEATIPDWARVEAKSVSQGKIKVQDEKSGSRLVWDLDRLAAGETERMVVRVKAARSGRYQLDVQWSFAPRTSSASVRVHQPKLEMAIEGPDEVVFGRAKTYKVHVRNPGDGIAPGVVFTLSPDSQTPQTQRIGDIPPGKEALFEIELNARQRGDMKIQGRATGDLNLHTEAAKTVRVASAELEAVLAGPEMKYQNAQATYHLELRNGGSAPSEKVAAMLTLPEGVEYLGGLDDAAQQGKKLTWQIGSLAAGATREYEFQCKMSATGEQRLAFACQGSAGGEASVSIATEVGAIADLAMTISDPPAPAPVGEEVTYEIMIRNRGSKAATDVEVVAQFSHGIEPQRVEGQTGEIMPGQALFDAIDRIAAGEQMKLRVIAKAQRAGHHRFRSEIRSGDTVLVSEEATHFMASGGQRVSRRSSQDAAR